MLARTAKKKQAFILYKEIWSPIHIEKRYITPAFNGRLEVENCFIYTDLNQCSFEWKLVAFPVPGDKTVEYRVNATGKPQPLSLAPGEKGFLKLDLPQSWCESDALYLTANDPYNREIFTWSWAIKSPADVAKTSPKSQSQSKIEVTEQDSNLIIKSDGITYYFDKTTGYIEKVVNSKSEISLSGGPALAGGKHQLKEFKHGAEGESYIVEPVYEGDSRFRVKWIFTPGLPVKLEYQYSQQGEVDFMGITFNYPEDKITGMKWLGCGPYRVWKNRLKGMQFRIWQKDYNNSITGETWQYPEFKGYHAELYWVVVENQMIKVNYFFSPATIRIPVSIFFQGVTKEPVGRLKLPLGSCRLAG